MRKKNNSDHEIIIKPQTGWQLIDWKELFNYKDLFYFLILRDIKGLYKQTVLGFAWAIIRPLFSMVIFSIVFGKLANIDSDGIPYPIFSYAALVPWTYFSSAMTASTDSLISGSGIFTKVYFPRLVIPLTPVFAKLIDFGISFLIIFGLMIFYHITPTINILWIPLLIILMILTSAGIGMWLSALALQYRDIKHGIQFLAQLLMYAAPVVWPISLLTEKFGETVTLFYGLYPMAGVIEGFRSALLGHNPMPWDLIGIGSISAIVIFISGAMYFRKKERIFADVA
jgi:lipopolysaccharide transport system permease protein